MEREREREERGRLHERVHETKVKDCETAHVIDCLRDGDL